MGNNSLKEKEEGVKIQKLAHHVKEQQNRYLAPIIQSLDFS